MRNSSLSNYITILNYCLYAILSAKSISLVFYLSSLPSDEPKSFSDGSLDKQKTFPENNHETKEETLEQGPKACVAKDREPNEGFISFMISVILYMCFIIAGGFTANRMYFRIGVL